MSLEPCQPVEGIHSDRDVELGTRRKFALVVEPSARTRVRDDLYPHVQASYEVGHATAVANARAYEEERSVRPRSRTVLDFDEDPAHQSGRDREEMGSILPLHPSAVDEAQVGIID